MNQMNNNTIFQAKLKKLQTLIVDNFETIIDEFNLNLMETHNLWIGICPIHEHADNPTGLNFYKDGYEIEGYWRCNTRNCGNLFYNNKKVFSPNAIGFIRALLSVRELDWRKPGDETYGFKDTLDFLQKLFKIDLKTFKVDHEEVIKQKLIRESSHYLKQNATHGQLSLDISYVKDKLDIPAKYFIDRGFSEDTLKKFHVGFCNNPKVPLYNRAVCPILDEQGNTVVGLTGRTIHEKCDKCQSYHDNTTRCGYNDSNVKWWNVGVFKSSHLYNYWNAKNFIKQTKVAILVEGQGDVWRLYENGIQNCVGLFGVSLSDQQQFLLEKAGAMGVIPLFDNPNIDKAGEIAYKQFTEKCRTVFRIYTIKDIYGDKKDVGEFDQEQMNKLKDFIQKVERIYQ